MMAVNYKQNNEIDLEEFIELHGKALLHYIYSIMKHWELSEDIYQETLLSAFIHYKSFEKRASLKNWIYKIAQNKCKDEWKKENVRKRYLTQASMQMNEVTLHDETEDTVMENCLHEELMKKINELPNRYKNPILLYYFHDFTIMDISQNSELPMSTVKTHLRRGKEKLKGKVASIH
ncbi:RNA polymerase sigma factor [Heyndrickxia camelliae]|uniref:RNA polymerase factor sigma C n=1 Tax=Heyndrickxia camelliae TaxID=1707093 RepID=A0A2N3LK48_9BACI|nr:RNA polymerase sigma factor [Heyndrickxia camelliae]PKR84957.1 RNA polymerase factor sigma C [Heyndrickxia camelliae]